LTNCSDYDTTHPQEILGNRQAYLPRPHGCRFLHCGNQNSEKQRKSSQQIGCSLNPWSLDGRGFPRENATPLADNFPAEQQKQPEAAEGWLSGSRR
jgi:hypothetical protein